MQNQKNIIDPVSPSGGGGGIVYNVTIKVNNSIAAEWLEWIKKEHIPEVVGTGCFSHAVIHRLLETDETEGPTYAIQYHAANTELYNSYIQNHAPAMRRKGLDKWGDQFIAFRTVMHIVN